MIDIGLEKFFGSGKDEIYYGDVQVETSAYQDDILKLQKYKMKANKQLKQMPLMFGNFLTKRKVSGKYLGKILHKNGRQNRTN